MDRVKPWGARPPGLKRQIDHNGLVARGLEDASLEVSGDRELLSLHMNRTGLGLHPDASD